MKAASALCVGFLEKKLDDQAYEVLMRIKTDIDDLHVHGREVYWLWLNIRKETS